MPIRSAITSQSRVAKMEAADRSVSTDLLLKSLFRLGASPRDVARLFSQKARSRAAISTVANEPRAAKQRTIERFNKYVRG